LGQDDGAVAGQVAGRLVSGDEEEQAEAEQFVLAELLAVDVAFDEVREEVVFGLLASLVKERAEVADGEVLGPGAADSGRPANQIGDGCDVALDNDSQVARPICAGAIASRWSSAASVPVDEDR